MANPGLGFIPVPLLLLGAAGAAAWLGSRYSVDEVLGSVFRRTEEPPSPVLVNPPRFPAPVAPATEGEMESFTPEQMEQRTFEERRRYREQYRPGFEWVGPARPRETNGNGELGLVGLLLLGAGVFVLIRG